MSGQGRPIFPGDGDPRHGTYTGYSGHGCRCADCRAAKAAYVRARRAEARTVARRHTDLLVPYSRRLGLGRHFVADVRHGTSYAYYERGCRCWTCTDWGMAEARKRNARRRAEKQPA